MSATINLRDIHTRVACVQAECALWQIRRQWERLLATTTDEARRVQIAELLREGRCPPDRVIRGYHGRFVGCADGGGGSGHMPEGGIHTRGGLKQEIAMRDLMTDRGRAQFEAAHPGQPGVRYEEEIGRLGLQAHAAAQKMSEDDVAALRTHAANLEKLLDTADPNSLIGRLAGMKLDDPAYGKLRQEAETRMDELKILRAHLARYDGKYKPSSLEEQGVRAAGMKKSGARLAKAAKVAESKPAKAPSGRTKAASPAKANSTKSERESLDDLHAKARALRAKESLPDEVKPEDVKHTGKDNRPVIAVKANHGLENEPLPDPFALPDMHRYVKLYGEEQLGLALNELMPSTLRDIARNEGIEHPGSTKAEVLSRIVAKITQGRYSADFGESKKISRPQKSDSTKSSGGKRLRAVEKYRLTQVHVEAKFNVPQNVKMPDPFAVLDPRRYTRMYGPDEAPKAFNELMLTTLKSIAAKWQEHFPGDGAPRSWASKRDIIDYLMKVTEQHDGKIRSQADADRAWQNDPNLWDVPGKK